MRRWPPDWWDHLRQRLAQAWWAWVILVSRPVPAVRTHSDPRSLRGLGSRRLRALILAAALGGITGVPARYAAAMPNGEAPEERVAYGEVTGQISAVSKQGIAIEYSRTKKGSYERFLPFSDTLHLPGLQSLAELKAGDTVKVEYQQTYKDGKDGQRVILKTAATRIKLVKRAPQQTLISEEEAAE